MKGYVISIIIVGVIGSFVTLLAPEGEGGGLGKHARLAVGLCVILVCIAPLNSLLRGLSGLDLHSLMGDGGDGGAEEYESIFDSSYSAAEIENLREGIKTILFDKFGVEPSECYVKVTVSGDAVGDRRLERIFINLYGSAIWRDTGAIEDYLSSLFGCEIVTAVG